MPRILQSGVAASGGLFICGLLALTLIGCDVKVSTGEPEVVISVNDQGDVGISHEGTGRATHKTLSSDDRTELELEASTFGGDPIVEVTGDVEPDGNDYHMTLELQAERTVALRITGLADIRIEHDGASLANPASLEPGEYALSITGSLVD